MNYPNYRTYIKSMFVGCSYSREFRHYHIAFTQQERQSAEIWRFKRAERITKQVRKDLIAGKIGWKRKTAYRKDLGGQTANATVSLRPLQEINSINLLQERICETDQLVSEISSVRYNKERLLRTTNID
jgi:hypothetical protein